MKKINLTWRVRGLVRSTLFHIFLQLLYSTLFLLITFLSFSDSDPTTLFLKMAMQLPPTTLYAGRSSVVLPPTLHRSSFLPYYSMRLLGNKKSLSKSSSSAPRFSMRVSSKQAYICRDCGSVSILISLSLFLIISNVQSLFIISFF